MAAETSQKERGPDDKVALDTEGAAYLAENSLAPLDEQALPADTYMEDAAEMAARAEAAAATRRKRLRLAAIAVAAALLAAAVAWFFLLRTPSLPEPEAPAAQKPEVVVVPSQTAPAGPAELTSSFEPFWVEVPDGKGGTVFLTAKFSVISHNPDVPAELERSKLLLRDALYFYLKHKDAAYLTDAKNIDQIKKELADVLDGYLRSGQVEDMLFESYLSR